MNKLYNSGNIPGKILINMAEKLQAENYITSNNLARYADVVFSEALPTKLFQDLHINNVKVPKSLMKKLPCID